MKIMCPKCKTQRMKEDYSVPDSDQMYCPECNYTESRKLLECGEVLNKLESRLKWWYDMKPSEMRLHGGEMTNQEIRTVKAVLKNILDFKNKTTEGN